MNKVRDMHERRSSNNAEAPTWRAFAMLPFTVVLVDWAISWVADRTLRAAPAMWAMGAHIEYAVRFAMAVALLVRFGGKRGMLERLGMPKQTAGLDIRWGLRMMALGTVVATLVAGVTLFILHWGDVRLPLPPVGQAEWMRTTEPWRYIVRVGILTVICAPIVEEVIYRGILLRVLLARLQPWKAIGISAVVFALLHALPYGRGPIVPLELLGGVIFGLLFCARRSIIPGMLFHAAGNAAFLLFPIAHVLLSEQIPSLFATRNPGAAAQHGAAADGAVRRR